MSHVAFTYSMWLFNIQWIMCGMRSAASPAPKGYKGTKKPANIENPTCQLLIKCLPLKAQLNSINSPPPSFLGKQKRGRRRRTRVLSNLYIFFLLVLVLLLHVQYKCTNVLVRLRPNTCIIRMIRFLRFSFSILESMLAIKMIFHLVKEKRLSSY